MKTHQLRIIIVAFHPPPQLLYLFISRKISLDPLSIPLDHPGCSFVIIIYFLYLHLKSVLFRSGCHTSARKQDYLFLF